MDLQTRISWKPFLLDDIFMADECKGRRMLAILVLPKDAMGNVIPLDQIYSKYKLIS